MKKIIIGFVILILIGIGIYFIVFNNNPNKTPTNVGQSNTIIIKNFSFNPSTLTIKKGAKVTWVNNDTVSHTITSDSNNILNSSPLSPGQSFSFTFASSGSGPDIVSYHCSIHPAMKGTIIVEN